MEKHKPSPTEEVKDAVVRDYLRGDKSIVIQMEYDISPGVLYRILSHRAVKLRRPDLAVKRSLKVPTKGPEETPPAPVAAEAPTEEAQEEEGTIPEEMLRAGQAARDDFEAALRAPPPEVQGSGFMTAIKQMLAQDVPAEDVLGKVYDALAEWLVKEPTPTLKAIGLWEKATGEGIGPDDTLKAAMDTLTTECLRSIPGAEEITPGVWRLKKEGA